MDDLKVDKEYPSDRTENIARLHKEALSEIGVITGDTVLIRGKQPTVSVAERLDLIDPKDIVRIDSYTRQNADVEVGDTVSVEPISPKTAEYVSVCIEDFRENQVEAITNQLVDRVAYPNNIIPISLKKGLARAFLRSSSEDLVQVVIENSQPDDCIRITSDTDININCDEYEKQK